jgi:hypothetical protein
LAFLDPAAVFATGDAAAEHLHAAATDEPPLFTPLEWTVVALARTDSLASLRPPGALSRLVRGIFGFKRSPMLADTRLEALRRIAVHAWHRGYTLPISELKRFHAAGFTAAHSEALLARVALDRVGRRRRGAG